MIIAPGFHSAVITPPPLVGPPQPHWLCAIPHWHWLISNQCSSILNWCSVIPTRCCWVSFSALYPHFSALFWLDRPSTHPHPGSYTWFGCSSISFHISCPPIQCSSISIGAPQPRLALFLFHSTPLQCIHCTPLFLVIAPIFHPNISYCLSNCILIHC